MGSSNQLKGTVKWFDSRRGFGFITPEESGGKDLFVHKSSINGVGLRSLTVGETVEFVVSVGDDGRSRAVNVTGPGGVCIQGRRYFGGACYRCNEVGHMQRDCKNNANFCGCYSCGEMGHFARECPALAAMSSDFLANEIRFGTLGLLSESINFEEEEQSEKNDEDEPQRGDGERNWAELPGDILMVIFKKIAAAEILRSAQFVCKPWRQLSFVPALWRCIDMKMYDFFDNMESVAIMAVDRSEGCLEELHVEYFPTEKLMCYITERAPLLRRLHLISVCVYDNTLVETVQKFPLLEELEISLCSFSDETVEQVAQACPQLKSFRLNDWLYKRPFPDPESISDMDVDTQALAIAKHMKQLRRLQLVGNGLTSTGLLAILNNCPHLEYLDIRQCLNVDLDENLKKKCARIKVFRLPDDSTTDYEYRRASFDEVDAYDTYFDPCLSDTDYDFGYDDFFYYDHFGGPHCDTGLDFFYDDDE